MAEVLAQVQATGKLEGVSATHVGWSALKTIQESNADAILELSYTDLKTGQPALEHLRAALNAKKHVVTTNKGPIALAYQELRALAQAQGVELGVEGTVMSGTPTLRLGLELLMGANIHKVQGILNGTTNYILTRMEAGLAYADALAEAQAKGYAEADPTGDVEGHDAAAKVVILANLLMGTQLTLADVDRTGITGITQADVQSAQAAGKRWKLIGTVEKTAEGVQASVKPQELSLSHPLASVSNATNAITYSTQFMGDVTVIGAGAGRLETGYALVQDLLAIHRRLSH